MVEGGRGGSETLVGEGRALLGEEVMTAAIASSLTCVEERVEVLGVSGVVLDMVHESGVGGAVWAGGGSLREGWLCGG